MAQRDYYAILEIGADASAEEIRIAYRRLARRYHPDLHPERADANARLKELNEAYEVLGNPARRAAYQAQRDAVRIPINRTPPPSAGPAPPRPRRGYGTPPSHVDLTGGRYGGGGYTAADRDRTRVPYTDPWARGYPRTEEELLLLYLRRLLRVLGNW